MQPRKALAGSKKAALESVAEWRYQPSLVQGKPVEVVTTIEVNFRLHP